MSSYNNNILFVISFCCNTTRTTTTTGYAKLILQRIDKYIEITKESNDKEKREEKKNSNLSIDVMIKKNNKGYYNKRQRQEQYKVVLQERMLHLVPYK